MARTHVVTAFMCIVLLIALYRQTSDVVQVDQYKGSPWRPEGYISSRLIGSTKFGRCELHKVRTEKGAVVDDWLWFDDTDAVNILVQDESGNFLVFRQRKYGIPEQTLAVLGGMINSGEDALSAAKRELQEELQMIATEWVDLGTYRSAANRGGGYISCFFAVNAQRHVSATLSDDDLEARSIVKLTRAELLSSVLDKRFGEVKWTATVALALLTLQNEGR